MRNVFIVEMFIILKYNIRLCAPIFWRCRIKNRKDSFPVIMKKPSVDYRKIRFNNLKTEEFRHTLLLLYWPVFGILFAFVERFNPVQYYYPIHCYLDDKIPFCEWFFIPYLFWFVYLVGSLAYTLFYDISAFKKEMYFIIITYSVTIIIYLFFPTCQELRPMEFANRNILTDAIAAFYNFDTNTNVCPSLHVVGSFASMFALWECKDFNTKGWKTAEGIAAFLICISTVFMKQHSVIDVATALPLCAIGYYFSFGKGGRIFERKAVSVLK